MGLEQVITDVRRGGESRAKAILAKAHEEADAIVKQAQARVDEHRTRRQAATAREAEQLAVQVASSAEFEARKTVLTAEARLRRELRETLLAGFEALPAATRKKHVNALIKKAAGVVDAGKVWAAEHDLKALAAQDRYEVAGAAEIRGGIIVESADGTIRVDLSYETLLDDLWRDVLKAEAGLFE